MIDRKDVVVAERRMRGLVRRTPVIEARLLGLPLLLKLELLQHTGSFKPRGAVNRLLSADVPDVGVIAASGGNAGLGVAYAARALGSPAEIFVPESTPEVKISRLRELGAEVRITGAFYGDAAAACEVRAAESGALHVHAYDQPEVAAGNGTVGLELAEHRPDTVLVAVGGGGLAAGIAAALEGHAKVVAVEPVASQALHAALAAGRPVDVSVGGVAADSLGAPRVGEIAYAVAVRTGMGSVVVPDEAITAARSLLWEELRLVAEPGGATALAALVCGAYKPDADERVAVVVCGGNTDPATVA
ncbi:MAG TPA: threonine/serine dehydratase [Streptosporangiaceae bacterium]